MEIDKIKSSLHTSWIGKKIHFKPSIDSTNSWATKSIDEGALRGDVFLADFQTTGHGRMERPWESPDGKNILMSFIDQTPADISKVFQLTLVAGVAFQEGLTNQFSALPILLKWPNDLYLNGKKLGGILCEKHPSKAMVLVGVGINVNSSIHHFSPEVRIIATSIASVLGHDVGREDLIISCLSSYEKWRDRYEKAGIAPILSAWLEKTDMMGKQVRVAETQQTYEGIAKGLDADGFLLVTLANGQLKKVVSGDVVLI